jgi:Cu(I)/Ag(I) efflux system membrane fusion protein
VRAVSPRIDGWVERLYVDYTGRAVRAGEPLLAIYSPMLVAAQEELLLARRLARDVAGGTEDAARGADDLVAAARRRLALWEIPESEIARIESAGEARRTLTLRAPSSGVVTQKRVVAGQRVMAGDALFEIVDLGTVWVEGDVYEQDLARIRVGQLVVAELHALPGEQLEGRVDYVYPTLDPETRTARIRVSLPNPALRLKPGMAATLHVLDAADTPVLGVPRSAVLSTGERDLVFVRRADGKLEPREVAVGASGADRVEILRGLAPGETVVASATFLVDAESNLGAAVDAMADRPARAPEAAPAPAATGGAHRHGGTAP